MSKQVSGARVVCTIPCTLMCVHLFYISASTLSTCMFLNHLVHQRVYIYFTFQHQLWACACMCINFFFNPYFPAEGSCLGNFLENNDASSIFCKSADEKEFSCSQKKYKYRACPPINAEHLESKLKRDNFSNQPTPPRRAFQISENFHTADEAGRKVFIICSINDNFSNQQAPRRTFQINENFRLEESQWNFSYRWWG